MHTIWQIKSYVLGRDRKVLFDGFSGGFMKHTGSCDFELADMAIFEYHERNVYLSLHASSLCDSWVGFASVDFTTQVGIKKATCLWVRCFM